MQIHSVVVALSQQINKQKYVKTFDLLCAGNEVFVKYQVQVGVLSPKPLRLMPPDPTLFYTDFYHMT